MFGEWSFTYIAASYRLVDTASIYRLPSWSLPSAAPASGPIRSQLHWQRGHQHFVGFPPAMLSVGRPAPSTQAHLLIFCFATTMLPVGYPESPSLGGSWALGGSFLWDLAVVSLMIAIHFGTLERALPFCFDVRL